jgi:hypothetical protein
MQALHRKAGFAHFQLHFRGLTTLGHWPPRSRRRCEASAFETLPETDYARPAVILSPAEFVETFVIHAKVMRDFV